MLAGKKAYITAFLAIVTAAANYLTGDATPMEAAQKSAGGLSTNEA